MLPSHIETEGEGMEVNNAAITPLESSSESAIVEITEILEEVNQYNEVIYEDIVGLAAMLKALGVGDSERRRESIVKFERVVGEGTDLREAVSGWLGESVEAAEGMDEEEREVNLQILLGMAKRYKAVARREQMAHAGVAVKIGFTLFLGYVDVITDFLVAQSYYEVGDYTTAYATAGFTTLAITLQAAITFWQYGKKSKRERFGRTLLAMLGLGPLVEGAAVWTGKEDNDLVISESMMYASIKAFEIAFESIPESIIQVGGILKADYGNIKGIQIIGVISSVVAGAFIMTDANFGFILSKYYITPGDAYYWWIPKKGGLRKKLQMFGMSLFNACYFSQFVFAMSLLGQASSSDSMLSNPATINNCVFPFFFWAWYYMLSCAVPMLIAANPTELGPEVFAGIMVWRLLTNGGVIYLALGCLGENGYYLSLTTGMTVYFFSLGLAGLGLVLFFLNCDTSFDKSLFWRPKSGKQATREKWSDEQPWKRGIQDKDEERWATLMRYHPIYLPFEMVTPWICEDLVKKYEEGDGGENGVERPFWMTGENEEKFLKRIIKCYEWLGEERERDRMVNGALKKLFGRRRKSAGAKLEVGLGQHLILIQGRKGSRRGSGVWKGTKVVVW
ncbi:hypothetical protein TL16_g09560 [Triparma laevis f. inornata]|uniref:Uncharacterized protein n=1 Tax=Triparma laevis f. inornata TaxID=1714386 RepID=A0A9W7EJL6_9STRA|nr:hypothetical protein TL16_g09560 [Triparma laevis f. inornata]